jgi:hypothetical protein
VLIDKFSKWIEYMPLTKASSEKVVEFLNQIIHCFGLPNSIITDLGTQFTSNAFLDFYDERSIVMKYVVVAHPRANGQVERANGMILDALKKRLYRENDKAPRRWLKELPAMVWRLRTQPSRNTSASPYFMVYDIEVVLPADIIFRSPRIENWIKQVEHWPDPPHHLRVAILLEVAILLQLHNVFLALIFDAAQGHSGQNDAKGHTLTRETEIRKAATYWLSLGFWSSPPRSSSLTSLGAVRGPLPAEHSPLIIRHSPRSGACLPLEA